MTLFHLARSITRFGRANVGHARPSDTLATTQRQARVRRRSRAWVIETLETRVVPSTIMVTNTDDTGLGSLRAAISLAEQDQVPDTIAFSSSVSGTITLESGLTLSGNINILGPGSSTLTVARDGSSSTPDFGIFDLQAGAIVTIDGLSISGGVQVGSDGGGIVNSGTLTLTNSMIEGNSVAGVPSLGADGGGIYNSGTLNIEGSTISDNSIAGGFSGGGWGAGIYNSGTLNIEGSTISDNSIGGGSFGAGSGGGIYNSGSMTVTYSTIAGNSIGGDSFGDGQGGGIFNSNSGTISLGYSTISSNSIAGDLGSGGQGGGIDNLGTMMVVNTTVSGNSTLGSLGAEMSSSGSPGFGGGIFNTGVLSIIYGTISGNSVGSGITRTIKGEFTDQGIGGGLAVGGGTTTLTDTLIAGNTQAGTTQFTDVAGAVDPTSRYNLIGDGTGLSGIPNGIDGNLIGTASTPISPQLGPLADNGGPTLTQALLTGSPAIGAGVVVAGVTLDQRNFARSSFATDIGAFEVPSSPALVVEQFHIRLKPMTLLLSFNEPLNDARAEAPANYLLVGARRDRQLETGHGRAFRFRSIRYNPSTNAVSLRLFRRLPPCRIYRLTVVGTPPGGLTNARGVYLAGSGTGVPGSDYVMTFSGMIDHTSTTRQRVNSAMT